MLRTMLHWLWVVGGRESFWELFVSSEREEERAVSPVIGVILMVSITVVLASVVASFAFSLDFEHVRPIAEEILDGDLDAMP